MFFLGADFQGTAFPGGCFPEKFSVRMLVMALRFFTKLCKLFRLEKCGAVTIEIARWHISPKATPQKHIIYNHPN